MKFPTFFLVILLFGISCLNDKRYDLTFQPPSIPPIGRELLEEGFTFPKDSDMVIGVKEINEFTEIRYELRNSNGNSIDSMVVSRMETHIISNDINLENIDELIINSGGILTSDLRPSTPNPDCYMFKFKKKGYPLEFEGRLFDYDTNMIIITYPYYKANLN